MRSLMKLVTVSTALFVAMSCGGGEDSGTLTLSGDDDATDDDSAADDDTAPDDDATGDDAEDDDPLTGECPGYERCECESQGECFVGLRCWSDHCVDPSSPPTQGSDGGRCHGYEGCDCSPEGRCFDVPGLVCRSGLCVIPPENEDPPVSSDDDADDDDDDDSAGDPSPSCCTSGVCDVAIAVHTLNGDPIPAIELNACISDTVDEASDCRDPWLERAEDTNARSATWHFRASRESKVRLNGSLYKDAADVNSSGSIVGSADDWACFGQSSRELHARVSVRVCDDVDWLTVDDTFRYDSGCSLGVDFGDYIH